MVWEVIIGVILAIGILTTVREMRLKRARKNKAASKHGGSHDTNHS